MSAQQTFRDHLAWYFKSHPGEWTDGIQLAQMAGRYAWRSRVSDCRRDLGMTIENRLVRVKSPTGETVTRSFYRYVPAAPVPTEAHNLNEAAPGRLI